MAYCQHCGSTVPDGSSFCTNCGAPISTQSSQNSNNYSNSYNNSYSSGYDNSYGSAPQGYQGYQPYSAPVPAYSTGGLMAWSIITLLLCTIPGIVAIVKTTQINKATTVEEQQKTISRATTWCIVGTILGILAVIGSLAQNM